MPSRKLATGDWILILDADEWIHVPDKIKIKELIKDAKHDSYFMTIWNFLEDPRWNKGAQPMYGYAIRLFRNDKGYKYENLIHNELDIDRETTGKSGVGVINMNYKEAYRIDWKSEQNKRMMLKKISKHFNFRVILLIACVVVFIFLNSSQETFVSIDNTPESSLITTDLGNTNTTDPQTTTSPGPTVPTETPSSPPNGGITNIIKPTLNSQFLPIILSAAILLLAVFLFLRKRKEDKQQRN